LLLRVNFYTLQKIDLVFEIIENRLENQLDEVTRSKMTNLRMTQINVQRQKAEKPTRPKSYGSNSIDSISYAFVVISCRHFDFFYNLLYKNPQQIHNKSNQ